MIGFHVTGSEMCQDLHPLAREKMCLVGESYISYTA